MKIKPEYGYAHWEILESDGEIPRIKWWIEDSPMAEYPDSVKGWYIKCQIQPNEGIIGPFDTEEEAVKTSTDYATFMEYMYGPNPMGNYYGTGE